jgi:hypothetical protein
MLCGNASILGALDATGRLLASGNVLSPPSPLPPFPSPFLRDSLPSSLARSLDRSSPSELISTVLSNVCCACVCDCLGGQVGRGFPVDDLQGRRCRVACIFAFHVLLSVSLPLMSCCLACVACIFASCVACIFAFHVLLSCFLLCRPRFASLCASCILCGTPRKLAGMGERHHKEVHEHSAAAMSCTRAP